MQLHRSNRAEALVDVLTRIVARPPADPFEAERIVVQGPGMERWLSLELASRLGVFANARFPFPRAFLQEALTAVLGDAPDAGEEWEPEGLLWAVASLLPERLEDPRFGPIRRYLGDDDEDGEDKAIALARRIAETFDHYAVHRPEMVAAWERGDDGATRRWAGIESPWQPVLWRDLVARQGRGHWAARIERLVAALEAGDEMPGRLPSRASLFGLSTLPPLFVSAFAALSSRIALHAFVLSPSREYWGSIRSAREMLRERRRAGPAADGDDALHLDEGHPLLASLGRVGRDFQEILEERVDYHEADVDLYVDPAATGTSTLLHGLQSDILALRQRGEGADDAPPRPLARDDHSISIHACHGPMREAQVLRDRLLDLFAKDPGLAPHDVVVMAPDAGLYAPYVEAAFAADDEGGQAIPVRAADRGARTVFPVVEAFGRVIRVLGGRVAASEVLDLIGTDCIRSRFGIDAEEEALLRAWIEESGIRWGIDARHREREGQPAAFENTWRFGLDRLFTGMAIEDRPGRLFVGVAPQPGIEGAEALALGRLAELTSTLFDLCERARGARPVAAWGKLFVEVLDRMVDAGGDAAHERQRVVDAIDVLVRGADRAGHRAPVGLGVVSDVLDAGLARSPAQGGFLTGAVTVCEMLPMRSIPFRVVCLLGMNDKAFPRVASRPGFDLIGARRRVGDRSSRDDDRQLFLEALLSARDRVILTYVGRDIRDNEKLPPSVVVDELLDHVGRAACPVDDDACGRALFDEKGPGAWARVRLVIEHPLQPWSPRYFADDRPEAPLFSYSAAWATAARELAGPGAARRPFVAEVLADPAEPDDTVRLEDLQAWLRHPARFLVRDVLGIRLESVEDVRPDREPLEIEGLEAFDIGAELLEDAIAGLDPMAAYPRMAARGRLPLGEAGRAAHAEIAGEVRVLARLAEEACAGEGLGPVEVDLPCAGVRITGRLDGLHPGGRVVHRYAKLGQPAELEAWIAHVVLCAVAPEGVSPCTHLVGRRGDDGARAVRFDPVERPLERLAELVSIYRAGRTRALPLFPRTSRKYVTVLLRPASDDEARARQALLDAYEAFEGTRAARPEAGDPYVRQLFDGLDPLSDAGATVADDAADLGFRALARRVFEPLLAARSKQA
jgi:exodeoxyribonuclease V gamma subunit